MDWGQSCPSQPVVSKGICIVWGDAVVCVSAACPLALCAPCWCWVKRRAKWVWIPVCEQVWLLFAPNGQQLNSFYGFFRTYRHRKRATRMLRSIWFSQTRIQIIRFILGQYSKTHQCETTLHLGDSVNFMVLEMLIANQLIAFRNKNNLFEKLQTRF